MLWRSWRSRATNIAESNFRYTQRLDFSEFVDHYETAVVDLLKQKQAGKAVSKTAAKAPSKQTGNVIDLLKKSLELSKKEGRGVSNWSTWRPSTRFPRPFRSVRLPKSAG